MNGAALMGGQSCLTANSAVLGIMTGCAIAVSSSSRVPGRLYDTEEYAREEDSSENSGTAAVTAV